jgi:hypothetical protein
VPVQPAALELLTALSKVLARWGRWYVFGAQAVIAYGVPRLSADVVAKILAGRPKDFEDARGVWRLHGRGLDIGRIRRTLGLLEQALGQSDLLPAFESILDRGSGGSGAS